MLRRRYDLPLERDNVTRFLPWLIAFMAFMAALACAGLISLERMVDHWDRSIVGTLTVQILPLEDATADTTRIQAVLDAVRRHEGVDTAEHLDAGHVAKLLEPWLGRDTLAADLPLPHLLDVRIEPGEKIDTDAMSDTLRKIAPGTSVDDHGVWLAHLVRLIRALETIAASVLSLIALAMIGTIVFTTRTALAVHRDVIEVLHLIGAQDAYIARQFAWRAFLTGLQGGIIGLILAVPSIIAIGWLAGRIEEGFLPEVTFSTLQWGLFGAVPLFTALVAMWTARFTVMKTLKRMI